MKKIHKHLKSEADFVARPFAMRDHEHTEYIPKNHSGPVLVTADIVFSGNVVGIGDVVLPAIQAGEPISALRILSTGNDGLGYYSDPTAEDSVRRILGVTVDAGPAGSWIQMHREGRYQDPSWNFDVTKRLFLGTNGTITQVAPTTGVSVVLGHAQEPDTIFLNIEKPIILI